MFATEYEAKDQILQLFNNMLNVLELDVEILNQNFEHLFHQQIYMQVANALFPFLQFNLLQIQKRKESSAQKLEKLIRLLQQDIIKRDMSHIKGKDITTGNLKSIYALVSLLFELTKKHINNMNQNQEYQSQNQHQEPAHSVLGIQNQFFNNQEQEQEYSQQQQADEQYSPDNQTVEMHEQKKQSLNQKNLEYSKKYQNVLMNNKIIENQVKDFRSKSKEKDGRQSESISDNYGQTLERKHKSSKQLKKYKSDKSIKETIKKQIENRLFHQKTHKKLTTNAKNKMTSPQKISKQQREFNQTAFNQIKKVRQKMKSQQPNLKLTDKLSLQEIEKKKKQLKTAFKDFKQVKNIKQLNKKQIKIVRMKNQENKLRLLKLQKEAMKRNIKTEELALELKLRDQKYRYIKKINKIVQRLQKDKNTLERKQFRQKLTTQNKLTSTKLQALENHYKSQVQLLKQKQQEQRQERKVIQGAHREIIQKLQKELKKDNENKIKKIQDRYREEYNKLLDLEDIQGQLIKLYKKY